MNTFTANIKFGIFKCRSSVYEYQLISSCFNNIDVKQCDENLCGPKTICLVFSCVSVKKRLVNLFQIDKEQALKGIIKMYCCRDLIFY